MWVIENYYDLEEGLFHFPIYMKKHNKKKFPNKTEEFEYQIENINNSNTNFILKKTFLVNTDGEYGDYQCICCHNIKNIYVIMDKNTNRHFGIGSECIEKNFDYLETEIKDIKKRKDNNNKGKVEKRYEKVFIEIRKMKTPYYETKSDKRERLWLKLRDEISSMYNSKSSISVIKYIGYYNYFKEFNNRITEKSYREMVNIKYEIDEIEYQMGYYENRLIPIGKLKGRPFKDIQESHMYNWFKEKFELNNYPFNKYVDLCRRMDGLKSA